MKSTANYSFSQVPAPQIQRSVFNRSHGRKTTFNEGYLVPIFLDEILPGDTVTLRATFLARLSTLIFPIMDNIFLDFFFFFVPNRLLWVNWEAFNGSQVNPDSPTDFLIPILDVTSGTQQFGALSLFDYFGLPTGQNIDQYETISALPSRAYNLIWNEWFRDQNLQNSAQVDTDNGPDSIGDYGLKFRGKRHDYFSSCLPWPQKGASVMLPLGTNAPVVGNGMTLGLGDDTTGYGIYGQTSTSDVHAAQQYYGVAKGSAAADHINMANKTLGVTTDATKSGLIADLSQATAATINQLRLAFAYQKVLERDARGGTRYVEYLKAHFGVTSPDFRLQRPEYLGGSSQRINVSQVPQTSETATTPQAGLAAYGTVVANNGFHKSFVEHGYILGLANVRADITYQQQLHKMWTRQTRFDFYLPALAHLGEQAVLNKEIFYTGDRTHLNAAFGYQERWAEYRYYPSQVTGAMRSNYPGGGLDAWHLALDFTSAPALDTTFIEDQPPIDRVVAVTSQPHVIMDSYFDIKHARPMPVYSVPGQLDRF